MPSDEHHSCRLIRGNSSMRTSRPLSRIGRRALAAVTNTAFSIGGTAQGPDRWCLRSWWNSQHMVRLALHAIPVWDQGANTFNLVPVLKEDIYDLWIKVRPSPIDNDGLDFLARPCLFIGTL